MDKLNKLMEEFPEDLELLVNQLYKEKYIKINKCVVITSHVNNKMKVECALNLIKFLKGKDIPIVFVGNYYIPVEIQKECDWVLYTKENPKLNRYLNVWRDISNLEKYGRTLRFIQTYVEWGYAHLLQVYRGFKFIESLGYNYGIHFNYDVEMNDERWDQILSKVELGDNLVTAWSGNAFATNLFCMNVGDLIPAMETNLNYYRDRNPPDIDPDWYCETFFKWMIMKSEIPHKIMEASLNVSSIFTDHSKLYGNDFGFNAYLYQNQNDLILEFERHNISVDDLVFHLADGSVLTMEKTNINNLFILPLVADSDYYIDNELIFNPKDINNFFIYEV